MVSVSGNGFKSSPINLAAVPDTIAAHFATRVRNLINDTVVAHSDAPVVLAAGEFATAGWPRILRERLERRDNAVMNWG